MKASDISEVKHLYQLDPDRCAIHRISGCFVNGDKTKVVHFTENFLTLPEEERFKYLELFRKCLSGTKDKNLLMLRPRQVHRDDHSGDLTGEECKLLQALIDNAAPVTMSQYFSLGTVPVQIRTSGYAKFADAEIDPEVIGDPASSSADGRAIDVTGLMTLYSGAAQFTLIDLDGVSLSAANN